MGRTLAKSDASREMRQAWAIVNTIDSLLTFVREAGGGENPLCPFARVLLWRAEIHFSRGAWKAG